MQSSPVSKTDLDWLAYSFARNAACLNDEEYAREVAIGACLREENYLLFVRLYNRGYAIRNPCEPLPEAPLWSD